MVSSWVLSIVQQRELTLAHAGWPSGTMYNEAICWLQQLVFSFHDRIHGSHWSIAAKGSAGNERKKWSIGWNQHLNNGMGNIDRSLTNELNPFSLYNETDTKADKWNRVKTEALHPGYSKVDRQQTGKIFLRFNMMYRTPWEERSKTIAFVFHSETLVL